MTKAHDILNQDPLRFNKIATYLAADNQPSEVLGDGGLVFRQTDQQLLVILAPGSSAATIEQLLAKNPALNIVECYLDKEPCYGSFLVKNGFYREHICILTKPLAQLEESKTPMNVLHNHSDILHDPSCSQMVADFMKLFTLPIPHDPKAENLVKKARQKLLDPNKQFYFLRGKGGEIAAMGAFVRESDRLIGVSYVYTAIAQRRQGYGRAIMAVLEDEAKRRNLGVFLHVNRANQSAMDFYIDIGYRQHSEFWRYRLHSPILTPEL